jgi:hypothetical protein
MQTQGLKATARFSNDLSHHLIYGPRRSIWPRACGVSFSYILSSQSFFMTQSRQSKKRYNSTSPALNDFIYVFLMTAWEVLLFPFL